MAPRPKSELLQDDFDDHEEVVVRYIATVERVCADGRIETHEWTELRAAQAPIRPTMRVIRGGLSCVSGAFRIIGAICTTQEVTPKVARTIREIARDSSNVVAFRGRGGGELPPAA